ncbi:MAG: ATP-binding cassette domain-containing protein [Ignavibacteria bacterium]|nr:ATP-binding cassette domain-containing protein [Ignavibacteria bacterium]
MPNHTIEVNDVSKAFLIGLQESRKETLGAAIFSWVRSPVKNYNILKRLNTYNYSEESEDLFWALRNVSFKLGQGETLGIIGNNGAGKSTLLKIISRITNPTHGYVEVNGRVSSLLEVGTGFHSELTGRENVYLNGTILGMSRKEIDKKFDAIVDFSEVEKFIDTQVKKYSTGMRLRLAFSVAAFLEPDVMIIDEVLAVGDAPFRKKSLTKMIEVAKGGTSVILVSHNPLAVQQLCKNTILLTHGRITDFGATDEVMQRYLGGVTMDRTIQEWSLEEAPSSDDVKLIKAEVRPSSPGVPVIRPGDGFEFEFVFYFMFEEECDVTVTFHLNDEYENLVFIGSTALTNLKYIAGKGYFKTVCRIPPDLLNGGTFTVTKLFVLRNYSELIYEHNEILSFEITSDYAYEHGNNGRIDGLLKPKLDWEVKANVETEMML